MPKQLFAVFESQLANFWGNVTNGHLSACAANKGLEELAYQSCMLGAFKPSGARGTDRRQFSILQTNQIKPTRSYHSFFGDSLGEKNQLLDRSNFFPEWQPWIICEETISMTRYFPLNSFLSVCTLRVSTVSADSLNKYTTGQIFLRYHLNMLKNFLPGTSKPPYET